MSALLLLASVPLVLVGAVLFTNAVEWLGHRLRLGEGAVGSLIAAVGTALPESVIPIVALIGGKEGSTDVAIGAIVGAPFVLATVGMVVLGASAAAYRRRRETGLRVRVHEPTVRRDLLFFFAFFSLGLALGLGAPRAVQKAAAAAFPCAFVAFAWWTVRAGGQSLEEAELRPLYLDRTKFDAPATWEIAVQTVGGLALLIGGAELFVEGVLELAEGLDLGPLVITLVLGPLITEIPEKLNSVIWMRESKDTLAVGNITGAMAFQSTVPIGIGLAFSNWELDRFAVTAGMLGLAGGAIAYWALLHRQQLAVPAILGWCAAFGGFVLFAVSGSQP